MCFFVVFFFFFFKQKTAYEIRPRDWSSDVCSSDLPWKCYQNEVDIGTGLKGEESAWLGNFGDNPLEYVARYRVRFHPRHYAWLTQQAAELPDRIVRAEAALAKEPQDKKRVDALAELRARLEQTRKDLVTWHPDGFARLSEEERLVHRQAFTTNEKDPAFRQLGSMPAVGADGKPGTRAIPQSDVLAQFRADVADGPPPPAPSAGNG